MVARGSVSAVVRPARWWFAVGAVPLIVSASCASSTSDDASTSTGGGDPNELSDAAIGYTGRYAHFDSVAYENDEMKTLIVTYGLSDLEVRDGELWTTQQFCHAEQRSDQPIETSISDAATRAIIPESTPVDLSEDDGRLRVRRPATPTPIGIDLENPETDELPSDPSDPRIVDDDGDGNPGITVNVKVSDELQGEIYLARREIFAYDLTAESDDRLVGTVTDDSEQLVIGASDDVFLATGDWVQHPDPAKSPIVWQRVGDDWDCERLLAERADILPPVPEVDW